MIDKVLSTVLLIMMVVILSLVAGITYTASISGQAQITRMEYWQEFGDELFQAVLLTHEGESLKTYNDLLLLSLKSLSLNIYVDGKEIHVDQKFKEIFDKVLGPNNYYIKVSPVLQGLTISYVIDGSSTMAEERDFLKNNLPSLVNSMRSIFGPETSFFVHIYILGDSENGLCDDFNRIEGVDCRSLSGNAFYDHLAAKGFDPPVVRPYSNYYFWFHSTHYEGLDSELSESDWASGSAYASFEYQNNYLEQSQTNKQIIVVIADELSSTSKADYCFTLTDSSDFLACVICNQTCPVERSSDLVDQAAEIIRRNNDLFIGFYQLPCNYDYDDSLVFDSDRYVCSFVDNPAECMPRPAPIRVLPGEVGGTTDVNLCDQNKCGGCTDSIPEGSLSESIEPGKYCFHRNCDQFILDQLETLKGDDGVVTPLDNLNDLIDVIRDYFNNKISNYNFSLGAKYNRDHIVIKRKIPISSGHEVDIELWIYQ